MNVGVLMFIPYRAMENRIFAALVAAGFDDFTLAQARLVQRLGPDGTRLTELAEAAQVTKQTASHLVDQLEKTGYVRRTPDPSDGRARLIRAAERGLAAKRIADPVAAEVEAGGRGHPRGPRDPAPPGGAVRAGGGPRPPARRRAPP